MALKHGCTNAIALNGNRPFTTMQFVCLAKKYLVIFKLMIASGWRASNKMKWIGKITRCWFYVNPKWDAIHTMLNMSKLVTIFEFELQNTSTYIPRTKPISLGNRTNQIDLILFSTIQLKMSINSAFDHKNVECGEIMYCSSN